MTLGGDGGEAVGDDYGEGLGAGVSGAESLATLGIEVRGRGRDAQRIIWFRAWRRRSAGVNPLAQRSCWVRASASNWARTASRARA